MEQFRANMTKRQQQLVKTSFRKAEHLSHIIALCFYKRLFELDPSLRLLFHTEIEAQSKKLMQALSMIAEGIDSLPELVPAIESLGRRHVHYGVKAEHYATVGEALLWSFDQTLGADFTVEVRTAWATAFYLIADTMTQAAAAVKVSGESIGG